MKNEKIVYKEIEQAKKLYMPLVMKSYARVKQNTTGIKNIFLSLRFEMINQVLNININSLDELKRIQLTKQQERKLLLVLFVVDFFQYNITKHMHHIVPDSVVNAILKLLYYPVIKKIDKIITGKSVNLDNKYLYDSACYSILIAVSTHHDLGIPKINPKIIKDDECDKTELKKAFTSIIAMTESFSLSEYLLGLIDPRLKTKYINMQLIYSIGKLLFDANRFKSLYIKSNSEKAAHDFGTYTAIIAVLANSIIYNIVQRLIKSKISIYVRAFLVLFVESFAIYYYIRQLFSSIFDHDFDFEFNFDGAFDNVIPDKI